MKAIGICFIQLLRSISKDMMLIAACIGPILYGFAFRFGVPLLESKLCEYLNQTKIIAPYYGIFDLFFVLLTPMLLCFAGAMVVLEELDLHIAGYLFITSLGKKGYLLSRFVMPMVASFIYTVILFPFFRLCDTSVVTMLATDVIGTFQGIIIALMVVVISTNKLEGMAITKLSGIVIIGIFLPYFVQGSVQYVLFFLPSLWLGKLYVSGNLWYIVPALGLSVVWIGVLAKRFGKKTL